MSDAPTSLFLVERYEADEPPGTGLTALADTPGTNWHWGVELVDEGTSLAVVEAADVATLLEAARGAGVELHHISEARTLHATAEGPPADGRQPGST